MSVNDILYTAIVGRHSALVRATLGEPNANPNARTADGRPYLRAAAYYADPDSIVALVQAGADVNARSPDGTTALMAAAEFDRAEVVAMLIGAGADPGLSDQYGRTAHAFAERFASTATLQAFATARAA